MASNRITEGVGKKIVEALKMQSEVEITPMAQNYDDLQNEEISVPDDFEITEDETSEMDTPTITEDASYDEQPEEDDIFTEQETPVQPVIMPQMTIQQPFVQPAAELDGFEIPSNVAVLKQLISKLPAGVTKQTGAMIIKQTMEALGISMKSVLQEAQQVQEGLNNSSRECQASIMEYKKQIGILEKQAQKYQRQYAALNDIISLFVQTNI